MYNEGILKTNNKKIRKVLFLAVLVGALFSVSLALAYDPYLPPPLSPSYTPSAPPSSPRTIPPPPGAMSGRYMRPSGPFSAIPPPGFGASPGASLKEKYSIPEFVDFAVTKIQEAKIAREENMEGFLISFTLENSTEKEYGIDIHLVCSDFKTEKNIYPVKPGKSKQSVFHAFQNSASGREDEVRAFVEGKKVETCSLGIAHVQHDNFSDSAGPADDDTTNNAITFKLSRAGSKIIVRNPRQDLKNVFERVKKLQSPLSEKEQEAYAALSSEKCLNILIASGDRGAYYNGEPLDPKDETASGPWIKFRNTHIAGDRLGYVDGISVIIDNEYVGDINEIDAWGFGPEIDLYLNEKHYAYARKVAYDAKNYMSKYDLIFDGKNLGDTGTLGIKLNGDYVIYPKSSFTLNELGGRENVRNSVYANRRKLDDGVFADYDGKNLIFHDVSGDFVLNGKKLGYGGEGVLKDGHIAYILGKTENVIDSHVFLDGKDLGPGRQPVIEKNHIAFLRAQSEIDPSSGDRHPKVIYNGRELGYIGGRWRIDLAGNHIAYMRRLPEEEKPFEYPEDFSKISIDGKDYPGNFFGSTYVEIEEKRDRRECSL